MLEDRRARDEIITVRLSSEEGKHRVTAMGIVTKEGIIVCILGGDKPHVGAIALGIPRPSLRDPRVVSATASVLTLVGHKDDEIAKPIAENFAKELNQTTVVIVGVHIEEANESDIAKLISNCTQVADKLLEKIIVCSFD